MRAPLDPRDVERLVRDLPRAAVSAPEQLWESIRAELAQPGAARGGPIYRRPFHAPLLAAAAVTLAVLGGAAAGVLRMYTPPSHWAVVPLAGSPKVGGQALAGPGDLARGEWLETDARSRARLALGNIGTAQVGPGSRVRLERSGLFEQRLSVQRGSLHAVVSAPPRLFVVETPVVRATDLGCAYTLVVDSTGASRLRVIAGSVELAAGGMVTVVPMGLMLEVDVGGRPGTPYRPSMPPAAQAALHRIDAGDATSADVATVLATLRDPEDYFAYRRRSAITLWHVLQRVVPTDRAAVYALLTSVYPEPRGVTREGMLALDRQMVERWRADLYPTWSAEGRTWLTRLARRLWELAIQ